MMRRWHCHQTGFGAHYCTRTLMPEIAQPIEASTELFSHRIVSIIMKTLVLPKRIHCGNYDCSYKHFTSSTTTAILRLTWRAYEGKHRQHGSYRIVVHSGFERRTFVGRPRIDRFLSPTPML